MLAGCHASCHVSHGLKLQASRQLNAFSCNSCLGGSVSSLHWNYIYSLRQNLTATGETFTRWSEWPKGSMQRIMSSKGPKHTQGKQTLCMWGRSKEEKEIQTHRNLSSWNYQMELDFKGRAEWRRDTIKGNKKKWRNFQTRCKVSAPRVRKPQLRTGKAQTSRRPSRTSRRVGTSQQLKRNGIRALPSCGAKSPVNLLLQCSQNVFVKVSWISSEWHKGPESAMHLRKE